jgi:hypothetical protein
MSKLSEKIKEEIEALLPPTIFFFVALHLVAFVRVLMRGQDQDRKWPLEVREHCSER